MKVLLIANDGKPGALALSAQLASSLKNESVNVVVPQEQLHHYGREDVESDKTKSSHLDLVVSIGGDGTMLNAVSRSLGFRTPVLGVNMGQLGYLTQVEPDDAHDAVLSFLKGTAVTKERMTIEAETTFANGNSSFAVGLNDIVLEKYESSTIRIAVEINDQPFLSYALDALIISTPIGSTAYNLSARGPILSPSMEALVITPVAPHMLFDRSVVLDAKERDSVSLSLLGKSTAELQCDGKKVGILRAGDKVICRKHDTPALIVTNKAHNYRKVLSEKFGLLDR